MPIDFSNIKDSPSISIQWLETCNRDYNRKVLQIRFHYLPSDDLFRAILDVGKQPGFFVVKDRMLKGEIHIACPSNSEVRDVAKEFARFMEQDFGRISWIRPNSDLSPLPVTEEDAAYAKTQGGFTLNFETGLVEQVEVDQEATDAAIRRRLFGRDPLVEKGL